MKLAPIPENEKERLISLHKLGILDTEPEERFDRITRLATKIFNVPMSTLTIVDSKREWFKSVCGLHKKEGDRSVSFCGHALLANKVFVIPDTKKDKRFANNPMVIGKPYIRFYAGVPIMSANGERIGVFCVKDIKPRTFSNSDRNLILGLAAWAEIEINSRNLSLALIEVRKGQTESKARTQEFNNEKIATMNVLEDLEDEKQKLVKVDRAKSEFVSLASHQLRTPLTTVNWYSEMLLQSSIGDDPKKRKEYLEKIHMGSERMVVLVNMLLNVSRIELGTLVVELKPVQVTELLLDVINEQKLQIVEKTIILTNHFPDALPLLETDSNLLRMVFQNLFSNALKYTPAHGHIDIGASVTTDQNFLVTFADTGYGIPKKDQDKIFTKMFRADNIKEKVTEGTGLGLYIVREVLRSLGGSIRFISEEDKGTTFYVTLPFNKVENK